MKLSEENVQKEILRYVSTELLIQSEEDRSVTNFVSGYMGALLQTIQVLDVFRKKETTDN